LRLATFTQGGSTRIGVVVGEEIVDLSAAASGLPTEMKALLAAGEPALATARSAAESGKARIPLTEVTLEAPVLAPPKFIGIGLNYRDHAAESGMDIPEHPMMFNKQSTCVVGPDAPVHLPRASKVLDYEGELGVVIGRRCRHVPKDRAHEVIAGYTIVNDVSVRDWQMRVRTMTIGKSFDTHGPMGPWIVTADEIGDPHALRLQTWINGEKRQDSNTKELIFNAFDLVEHLSTAFTLEPGDVIATGTPAGVGIAFKPPKLLKAGDVVRIEIDGIGVLQNEIIDEPESTTLI
jgi:2-keto-4-pentenoate hydratase/2-oxohepta-3-ene-1,7-dioic acid hydratase in catechol pathway